MAAKAKGASAKPADGKQPEPQGNRKSLLAVAVVVVFVILFIAFVYQYAAPAPQPQSAANLSTFLNSYSTAPRAGIAVLYSNGSIFGAGVGCATAVIEQLTIDHQTHRNSTTLDFFVINQSSIGPTGCLVQNGLGTTTTNSTNSTSADCTAQADAEPTVFIGYNATNGTTITPASLSIHGTLGYLERCGIASELSAQK